MKCAWQEFLRVLPPNIRNEVDKYQDSLWEVRMRLMFPAELVSAGGSQWMSQIIKREDIQYALNCGSRYSPWAASTIREGFLTIAGGHRIGICGEAVVQNGTITGLKEPSSLCIRIARDFPGIGDGIPICGSVLIIGSPGAGKTTLLRDVIRSRSKSQPVCVVDERGEIFPDTVFQPGIRTDVLRFCPKGEGISMALRTMGPRTIAVDEITAESDCKALVQCGWCGVSLLATAHASSREELFSRTVYQPLIQRRLFDWLVILGQDKSWKMERM